MNGSFHTPNKQRILTEEIFYRILHSVSRNYFQTILIWVAPINKEIGEYITTPKNNRECTLCPGTVEDEEHLLLSCPKYNKVRDGLFEHTVYCHLDFVSINITDAFISCMSFGKIANLCAKVIKGHEELTSCSSLMHSYLFPFLDVLYRQVGNLSFWTERGTEFRHGGQ